ncbi:MAG: hypothetical protein ACOC0Q_02815 [Wenzhouxiangella sp.]
MSIDPLDRDPPDAPHRPLPLVLDLIEEVEALRRRVRLLERVIED